MRRLTRREFGGFAGALLAPRVHAGGTSRVTIRRFKFDPAELTIAPGTSIVWTNLDSAPHTATDRAGSWDTKALKKNAEGVVTFDEEGVFDYYCRFHPNMKGRIVVAS